MGLIVFLLFVVGCFVVYPLPTMIAAKRNHPRTTAIFKLNLLIGWTIAGWLIALVWSCLPTEKGTRAKPGTSVPWLPEF